MSGKFALIVANTEYMDTGLAKLSAPGKDAEDFARVLRDQNICAFDEVRVVLNQPEHIVRRAIEVYFSERKPSDLVVFYFSGHGIRDELGALYLAVKNTVRSRLRSTAIKSDYVREIMDQSRSKRQVLILDCCNSGAFVQGTKSAVGGSMGTSTAFGSTGSGRVILTASDSTQFAWEGDQIIGETQNSLFTHFLVKGLQGEADEDGDGTITIDELYDYAYEQIVSRTPKQTPGKWSFKQQGEIALRQSIKAEDTRPVPLPAELVAALENMLPYVREGAIKQLGELLKSKNIGLARTARATLEKIENEDDSRYVASAAKKVLESTNPVEDVPSEYNENKAKAEELAKKKLEEESLAQKKADAIRIARERMQFEQRLESKPLATAVVEEKASKQQPGRRPIIWITFLSGSIILFLFFCVNVNPSFWQSLPFFPPTAIPTSAEVLIPASSMAIATNTAIMTSMNVPTVETQPIPLPTETPISTITSPAPTVTPQGDPAEFLLFYFKTVISGGDLTKGWSLLTPAFQSNVAKGWKTYYNFWTNVRDWTYSPPHTEYNNLVRARVSITYTLFYKDHTKPSVLDDVKYCLLWKEEISNWQIDVKDNCP